MEGQRIYLAVGLSIPLFASKRDGDVHRPDRGELGRDKYGRLIVTSYCQGTRSAWSAYKTNDTNLFHHPRLRHRQGHLYHRSRRCQNSCQHSRYHTLRLHHNLMRLLAIPRRNDRLRIFPWEWMWINYIRKIKHVHECLPARRRRLRSRRGLRAL